MTIPVMDRLMAKVSVQDDGCWRFTGAIKSNGYGVIGTEKKKVAHVHRVTFEHLKGPIPEGMDLDHLCRNRWCCNPDHLEPVSRWENLKRSPIFRGRDTERTHCKRGHRLDETNVYHRTIVNKFGPATHSVTCKTCQNINRQNRKTRIKNNV